MSSTQQYKDSLKREKQINNDLRTKMEQQRITIQRQAHQISRLSNILNIKPKWWQFWKHL